MGRKTYEELKRIMEHENCSRIWSWSRVHCFMTSPYEYLLKYVKKVKEDRNDCIYASMGGVAHSALEDFYTGKIEYGDMIGKFEDGWTVSYDVSQMKFDRNDEEHDKKIAVKYKECLEHFFKNHDVIRHNVAIEQFVKLKIDGNLLHGYIDCCFKDDEGNLNIVDFKTSSIYKGAKAGDECGQLVLYAIALNQMGIPMDKIRIAWNFLKYCTIEYQQANGTKKTREVERCKIGESLKVNAKMWLKKMGYEDEIDYYIDSLIDTNNIDMLPDDVKDKYSISDCYVFVPLEQKLIDRWVNTVSSTIKDIVLREKDYKETNSDKCFWDSEENIKKQSYYFSTLCGYSGNLHKPYGEYLDKLEQKKDSGDLLGVKSNETYEKDNDEIDLSWLNDIA